MRRDREIEEQKERNKSLIADSNMRFARGELWPFAPELRQSCFTKERDDKLSGDTFHPRTVQAFNS